MREEHELFDIPVDVRINDFFQLKNRSVKSDLGPTVIIMSSSLRNVEFRVLRTDKVFKMDYHYFINSYYKIEDSEYEDRSQ